MKKLSKRTSKKNTRIRAIIIKNGGVKVRKSKGKMIITVIPLPANLKSRNKGCCDLQLTLDGKASCSGGCDTPNTSCQARSSPNGGIFCVCAPFHR